MMNVNVTPCLRPPRYLLIYLEARTSLNITKLYFLHPLNQIHQKPLLTLFPAHLSLVINMLDFYTFIDSEIITVCTQTLAKVF